MGQGRGHCLALFQPPGAQLWRLCRSEEHTSELQSHSDLVCRLLLEKKTIREVIEAIRTQVAFRFEVEQRPELMRSCDEPVTAGDNTKFRNCCPWTPKIRLATNLHDM